jgi:heavy metal sensor kinase
MGSVLGRLTLRARLMAWHVGLLGLGLAVFSAYLYLRLQSGLLAQVDAALQVAAAQALAHVDDAGAQPVFRRGDDFPTTARHLGQGGFAVRLLAPDGTVRDGFGDDAAVPRWALPAVGVATLTGDDDANWRIYRRPIEAADGRLVGWLQVARSLSTVEGTLETLMAQIVLGLPVVLLVAWLGGHILAERALRPIDRITRTAAAIGADDLGRRIAHRGPADEVGRLAATFDRMLERLQRAFERERRFAADASHELRTPLTALKGRIEVTLDRARTGPEYRDALGGLGREVDRLVRLSTDLLFLARLDGGSAPRNLRALDLSDLLGAVLDGVRPLAEAKGLELVEAVPPALRAWGDADHLIRLVLNLLDNAVRYTPPGGRVTLRAEGDGVRVRVSIADTGPGIAREHLPHVFERFYRVEPHRAAGAGGAGLGLAIAHEIAHWHGGTLTVASELGRGTVFTVDLPVGGARATRALVPPRTGG